MRVKYSSKKYANTQNHGGLFLSLIGFKNVIQVCKIRIIGG